MTGMDAAQDHLQEVLRMLASGLRLPFMEEPHGTEEPQGREELRRIMRACRWQRLPPEHVLYRPGQTALEVYFVHQGLIRVFNMTESGDREFNKSFVTEGQFVGALVSPLRAQASPYTARRSA